MRRTVGPGEPIGIRDRLQPGTSRSPRSASSSATNGQHRRATRSGTTSPPATSRARTRSTSPRPRSTRAPARSARRSSSRATASRTFRLTLRVTDEWGRIVFEGETSTARMRRTFDELVKWLLLDNPVPPGSVLLTGTGLVPPDELHAAAGPLRRDPRSRDRNPRQSRRARIRADRKGARAMTETVTSAPARNYIGGDWRESADGAIYEKRNPWRPSVVTGVYRGVGRGGCARRDRSRARSVPRVVAAPGRTAGGVLREGSRRDRGAGRASRSGHDRGDGQAVARGAPGDPARRADPALCRRRGVASDRRDVRAVGRRPAPVHAPATARRRRTDHALELPDRDTGLEARAGAHLRQHARAQARVRGAAHGVARRRVLRGGRAPCRRAQRPDGVGVEGGRGDRLEPGRPGHLVHRLRSGGTVGA